MLPNRSIYTAHSEVFHQLRTIPLNGGSNRYIILHGNLHHVTTKRRRAQHSLSNVSVHAHNDTSNVPLLPFICASSHLQLLPGLQLQLRKNANTRWSSSSSKNNDGKSDSTAVQDSTSSNTAKTESSVSTESLKLDTTSTTKSIISSEHTSSKSGADESSIDSSVQNSNHPSSSVSGKGVSDAVVAATHELEQRIKRVVRGENLTIGDQLSVALIAIFTTIILTAPYAVRHMKQRASTEHGYEDRLQTDDPVDEFVKLARREWSTINGNVDDEETSTGNEENNQKFIEVILKDVLQSKTVQHAAQEFVIQIVQSERFQSTIQHFVKELWNDLITDPETVAQVIKLLEVAITSTPIKNAVIELILQIAIRETEFRDAMIQMIQNLGMDDDVRNAVVKLLSEATHTTLNDPDIFDHSMEFATDVVGDDIVQQTAGEALRKSVEHAVKPATTIILSAFGVGLLIFSFIALGYSRSSESEARVFASAARSLQSNAAIGMSRILNWPFRTLPNMVMRMCKAIGNCLSTPLHQLSKSVHDALYSVVVNVIIFSWKGIQSTAHWFSSKGRIVIQNFTAFIYKHAAATTSSLGVWIGASAIAVGAILENGIRTFSKITWMYTVQGVRYIGHGCWTITVQTSTYISNSITNFIMEVYQYLQSYDEW